MKWFKLGWFNSKDRENLKKSAETLEKIEKTTEVIAEAVTAKQPETATNKPYKNLIYSNGNLTVVFPDGTVLDKMNVDRDLFDKIRSCYTQSAIESLMIDKSTAPKPRENTNVTETEEETSIVRDNLAVLKTHKDFVVVGTRVVLKGVELPIPAIILASFIEILEKLQALNGKNYDWVAMDEEELFNQYQALKMFWLKLALNPLPQSREDLLTFCRKNDIRITNNGNLILYRRIVSKNGADNTYVTFISQTYYSLKKKGEDTRNYAVGKKRDALYFVDLREDNFVVDELIGNLQHLYLELPDYETNSFTAWHDRKVSIKIGGIYKIADNKINLNNTICAAGGLHAAAVDYNYSGFGDTAVVVLVNPSKAITVPLGETGKLRTTEMFIACINDKDHGVHFDESALTAFDEEYHDLTLEELEQAATSKCFDGLSVKDNVPAIPMSDLNTIKDMLKSRIKNII